MTKGEKRLIMEYPFLTPGLVDSVKTIFLFPQPTCNLPKILLGSSLAE